MDSSQEISRLRTILYRMIQERKNSMASIDVLTSKIKELEADVTNLISAHSTCPTSKDIQAIIDTVQTMSTITKASIARDSQ